MARSLSRLEWAQSQAVRISCAKMSTGAFPCAAAAPLPNGAVPRTLAASNSRIAAASRKRKRRRGPWRISSKGLPVGASSQRISKRSRRRSGSKMTILRMQTVIKTKKTIVVALVALAAVLIATTPMDPRSRTMSRIKIVTKKVHLRRRIPGWIMMLLQTVPIKMIQLQRRKRIRRRKRRRRKQRRKNVCKKKRMQPRRRKSRRTKTSHVLPAALKSLSNMSMLSNCRHKG